MMYNNNNNNNNSAASLRPKKIKATVVLTSVSLMGQWEDEVEKHAPGLIVRRFHPKSRTKYPLNVQQIEHVDIIISTATFQWPASITKFYGFHRVVMDEAHLLSKSRTANLRYAQQLTAQRKWCATATPCTTTLAELKEQLVFLGFMDTNTAGTNQSNLPRAFTRYLNGNINSNGSDNNNNNNIDSPSFQEFANEFSKYVTRHEKNQLVGGTEALRLPASVTKVVTLQMSTAERTNFRKHLHAIRPRLEQFKQRGSATFPLETRVLKPLSSDNLFSKWQESTKIKALLQDISSLEKEDPHFRVVVFTQYTHTHQQVVTALKKSLHIQALFEITGSSSATDRDFSIRCFQGPRKFPAVIVVTLRAGSVGMTLTMASRAYLMEPSIDPAAETQAMGQIHRLGQDRSVEVKKFVFADSMEANPIKLHEEIAAGRISIRKNNFVPNEAVKILANGLL